MTARLTTLRPKPRLPRDMFLTLAVSDIARAGLWRGGLGVAPAKLLGEFAHNVPIEASIQGLDGVLTLFYPRKQKVWVIGRQVRFRPPVTHWSWICSSCEAACRKVFLPDPASVLPGVQPRWGCSACWCVYYPDRGRSGRASKLRRDIAHLHRLRSSCDTLLAGAQASLSMFRELEKARRRERESGQSS
jgi:hypothetical protein